MGIYGNVILQEEFRAKVKQQGHSFQLNRSLKGCKIHANNNSQDYQKKIGSDISIVENNWQEILSKVAEDHLNYIKRKDPDNKQYADKESIMKNLQITYARYAYYNDNSSCFEISLELKDPIDNNAPYTIINIRDGKIFSINKTKFDDTE